MHIMQKRNDYKEKIFSLLRFIKTAIMPIFAPVRKYDIILMVIHCFRINIAGAEKADKTLFG